jgi:hypothetical protein
MPGTKGKSGGKRPGAGRPAKPKLATQHGEYMIFEQETIGGEIKKPLLARIVGLTENAIEWQVGDDIYTLRRPDEGEIGIV